MPNNALVEQLNDAFAINNGDVSQLAFESGPGGLVIARVTNADATAAIALQGAQVLEWTPTGMYPVIWLSKGAKFAKGKSVRGGVPICWPWFGAHAEHSDYPAHGFARTSQWMVSAATCLDDGAIKLTFVLPEAEMNSTYWPHKMAVEYTVTIGKQLLMQLTTRNEGSEAVTISQALHTYFAVEDVNNVHVGGLSDCDYLDKVEGFARKHQEGPIHFSHEVDRIYLNAPQECVIRDPGLERDICITTEGSASTVVWNPWEEKSDQMGDMGIHGYKTMVCIESANASEDAVTIAPASEHSLKVRYDVKPYA